MTRLTAKDFSPQLLELYDYYAHGLINRREFLDRAALFTLGSLTASALLASLSPDYALAEQVEFTDPDIIAEYVEYPSPKGNGQVRAYLVRPAKAAGKPLRWWSCMKTVGSILTSKTSRDAWPRPVSSPSPRMA